VTAEAELFSARLHVQLRHQLSPVSIVLLYRVKWPELVTNLSTNISGQGPEHINSQAYQVKVQGTRGCCSVLQMTLWLCVVGAGGIHIVVAYTT
jgi:hypothetical protein